MLLLPLTKQKAPLSKKLSSPDTRWPTRGESNQASRAEGHPRTWEGPPTPEAHHVSHRQTTSREVAPSLRRLSAAQGHGGPGSRAQWASLTSLCLQRDDPPRPEGSHQAPPTEMSKEEPGIDSASGRAKHKTGLVR